MNLLDKCLCDLLKQNGIFRVPFKYFKLKSIKSLFCVCVCECVYRSIYNLKNAIHTENDLNNNAGGDVFIFRIKKIFSFRQLGYLTLMEISKELTFGIVRIH